MSLDIDKLVKMGQKALDLDKLGDHDSAKAIRAEMEQIQDEEMEKTINMAPDDKKLSLRALDARHKREYSHLKDPLARAAKASEKMTESLLELNEALAPFRTGE